MSNACGKVSDKWRGRVLSPKSDLTSNATKTPSTRGLLLHVPRTKVPVAGIDRHVWPACMFEWRIFRSCTTASKLGRRARATRSSFVARIDSLDSTRSRFRSSSAVDGDGRTKKRACRMQDREDAGITSTHHYRHRSLGPCSHSARHLVSILMIC